MTRQEEGFSIKFFTQPKKSLPQREMGAFDGKIKGLRVYSRTLSPLEMNYLYQARCLFPWYGRLSYWVKVTTKVLLGKEEL